MSVHYDMNTAAIGEIQLFKSKETLKHVPHIGYT